MTCSFYPSFFHSFCGQDGEMMYLLTVSLSKFPCPTPKCYTPGVRYSRGVSVPAVPEAFALSTSLYVRFFFFMQRCENIRIHLLWLLLLLFTFLVQCSM